VAWQRFNRTSNVFEVSDDNGATWQPLTVAAAGIALPPNIAYRDIDNAFSVLQSMPGLNSSGPIESSNYIRSAGGLYDVGRGVAIGNWTPFTPVLSAAGGISLTTLFSCLYMLIGNTMFVEFFFRATLTGTPGFISLALPGGYLAKTITGTPYLYDDVGVGLCQTAADDSALDFYRTISGVPVWDAGLHLLTGILPIPLK
jgi:hypothetical protein